MQASPDSSSPYLLYFLPVFILASLILVSYIISFVGGWYALSRRFRAQSEPYGEPRRAGPFFYEVYLRFWTRYSSIIRIAATGDALYLSILFPFRIGHPPLSIPWNEVQFGRTRFLWRRYVLLTLGEQERIPMRISERMARKLGILDRLPA
ncbi:MAG: hypothetical protein ABSC76_03570 [Terracidiphilus sp.]|jgi:hypothetical protein